LDLTVKVTELPPSATAALLSTPDGRFPVCERCHDAAEIVVAVMRILPLEKSWALCGPCLRQLPAGFHLA
jgi:hypothetical protein